MNLKYQVLATEPELVVKFFYGENDEEYGEFIMVLTKEARNSKNPTDSIGVRGIATITPKSNMFAVDLSLAFARAMGLKV